ncbi:translocation/assembly module TamB domain-containing protein [Confluentibacter citreus]|uniref:translocation/assembly module TamB domain-containing protein n=1 Tax=Confluentibacter citreus TaxID=2007307 RepID=UPI000C28DCAB|nr:translocation/assembly module TamB domain-containing protein [Confluentibacter citreus]
MKKAAKLILKVVLLIVALFLILVISIQLPFVQNIAKNKAVNYLETKIKTKVEIGSLEISFPKDIILNDFYFEDQSSDTLLAGKSLKVDIGLFALLSNKVEINSIDLEETTINIKIDKDSISNFDYIIKAFETPTKPESDEPIELSVDKVNLNNIRFSYNDQVSNINTAVKFLEFKARLKAIDLEKRILTINSLELNNTNGYVTLSASEKVKEPELTVEENSSSTSWNITSDAVSINGFNFVFDNNNAERVSKGVDYNHLKINDLNLNMESLTLNSDGYSGTINTFNFNEKSGFVLSALTTEFNYTTTSAYLKNLYLETPQTVLKDHISVTYPSIASLSENPQNLYVDANLENSNIAFKDVLLFVPSLDTNDVFKNNPNAIVNFNAIIQGNLDDLKIDKFNAKGIGNTIADFNGTITGLPNVDKSVFDITILNFESSSEDIYAFIPKNTIPNTIQLPDNFNIKGHFKGSIHNFETLLDLKSSLGNAVVDATFDQSRKNNETYIADASLDNFDLGRFIKNNQFGKVTANATINGRSLDPSTATAKLTSKIVKLNFNNYEYQNLSLDGTIDNGKYVVNVNLSDPNLNFVLDANGSSDSEKPTLDLKLNIELVDLNKLNLHAGPLKMKGDIAANFTDLNPDNLNGSLNFNNFLVALETEQFPLDTISIRAVSTKEKDSIVLKSQFASGLIIGNYQLSTISNQLMNSVSKYYQLDKKYFANSTEQDLQFDVIIKDNPILKKIVPQITELSEINISGKYNSINDTIVMNASIPRLHYGTIEISNGIINANTKENALMYDVSIANIKNNDIIVPKTQIIGKIEDNAVDYELNIKDLEDTDRYHISGNFKDTNGASEIYFNPQEFLLNYENWTIKDDNLIRIEKSGILVNNFEIQNNQQVFSIQSETALVQSPIAVNFENFKLETLTNIVSSNFEMGGQVNGKATVKNITSSPLFVADLNIGDFTFKKDTIGTLTVKVDNETTNLYSANVSLTDNDNQLDIDGNYNISSKNLDFIVDIQKLNMASLDAFTLNNLEEGDGYLNGKLTVTGQASNPNVNGNIKFNEVGFTVVKLNSRFQLLNDNVVFNTNKIIFENFKLQDEDDNPLTVNGFIDSKDYTNLVFDLKVVARNFRAVNSGPQDNDLFYGELYLDNDLGIKGTLENPIIDGTVKINPDTKFTIVLPQNDPSIVDREGIVEFIDQDQPVLITLEDPTKQITQTDVTGINASVNISIDKEAEISVIIDEANGDYLKLQGEAELSGGIDPSGKTTLTGKYEFTGGAYEMNFNLIRRRFEIQSGSYILWTGEPTTANIHITAVYNVEASPIDLISDQLTGITAEARNTYKQKIPFETNLIMKGELMQPEITFDIVLPEGNNDVSTEIINATQAKLEQIRNDGDLLNKQVFALLLLNRFIGENPFQSEAGGVSGAFIAKQSASKILSQQLNNLAGDLIQGFELDFDLEATEDYSTGQKQERTDLNVALSKQLLNDRLKVTVGSSIGLEGAQQENEQASTIAGDVSADYLITKDGRYKLRAYRKNNYQVALQGQVIETGVAFIITMNYNKFRELFQKNRRGNRKDRDRNEI